MDEANSCPCCLRHAFTTLPTRLTLLCKYPKAQIWNNLCSCLLSKLSSHSHPSGYGKVPIHPFLGSDASDYSSASRGLQRLPRGGRQFSEPCSLIWEVCGAELVSGKIPEASAPPSQGRRVLGWPDRLGMAAEQPCFMSTHLLNNMNQDTTVLDSKSMWKYFWARQPPEMNEVRKMAESVWWRDCWPCSYQQKLRLIWPKTHGAAHVPSTKSQNTPPCLSLCFLLFSSNLHFLPCAVLELVSQLPKSSIPSLPSSHTHTHPCVPAVNSRRPRKYSQRKFKEDVKQSSNFTASQEIVDMLSLQDTPRKGTTDWGFGDFTNCFLPKQWHLHPALTWKWIVSLWINEESTYSFFSRSKMNSRPSAFILSSALCGCWNQQQKNVSS